MVKELITDINIKAPKKIAISIINKGIKRTYYLICIIFKIFDVQFLMKVKFNYTKQNLQ